MKSRCMASSVLIAFLPVCAIILAFFRVIRPVPVMGLQLVGCTAYGSTEAWKQQRIIGLMIVYP